MPKKSKPKSKKPNRLFVPLNTEPFLDFKHNGKTYELRICKNQYSEKHVYPGRKVELRHGYSGSLGSLWGTIGNVVTGTLEEILDQVDYRLISPREDSRDAAIKDILSYLGKQEQYIAFEVLF